MRHIQKVPNWHLVVEYYKLLMDRTAAYAMVGTIDAEALRLDLLGSFTPAERRRLWRHRQGVIDRSRLFTRWIRALDEDPRFDRAHSRIMALLSRGTIMGYARWQVS
jgi:hypothetical protein